MDHTDLHRLIEIIRLKLLPSLELKSIAPHDPVRVGHLPEPWQRLGVGNYAAVFCHPEYPEVVVKIYAPGRPGFEEEEEVYRRLGSHPAFSECLHAEGGWLILKRLDGVTLYDCMHLGIPIPEQVIRDVDRALDYARDRGLRPCDVHGRNVMMKDGRGLVVDVSDFLHQRTCHRWNNLKRAYYWLYVPILRPLRLRVPYFILAGVRKGYRFLSKRKYWGILLFLAAISILVGLVTLNR